MIKTIQVTGFLLCLSIVAFSADLIIGQADTVYRLGQDPSGNPDVHIVPYDVGNIDTDFDQNKWVADACVSYIRKDESTIISFWPLPNRIQRYEGTLKNPRMRRLNVNSYGTYQWGNFPATPMHFEHVALHFTPPVGSIRGTIRPTIAIFLKNIYQYPDNPRNLLGFTHNEILDSPDNIVPLNQRWYSVGVVFSPDLGESWRYCGDIIHPSHSDGVDNKSNLNNLMGVPYLIVEDSGVEYFYAYFSDVVTVPIPGNPNHVERRFTVARAPVADVLAAARNGWAGGVTTWNKFNGTPTAPRWTADGLTGQGTDIIPVGNRGIWDNIDIHGDATKCTFLKQDPYILVCSAQSNTVPTEKAITMYRSSNGLDWGPVTVIDSTVLSVTNPQYPFLMADQNASDDGHTMGSGFYIYYPRIDAVASFGHRYSIVRHRVSANPIPIITKLLSDY